MFTYRHLLQPPSPLTWAAILCASLLYLPAAQAQTTAPGQLLEQVRSSKTLTIGYRQDYPPFSYQLPDGSLVGYGIEMCRTLATTLGRNLGVPLNLRMMPLTLESRIPAVQNGLIDMECGTTTNTRQRREKYGVAFLSPYFVTGVRMLSHTRSGVREVADLRNKTLAYIPQSTAESIAQKYQASWGVTIRRCGPLFADCMRDLDKGVADVWLMDDIALQASRATSQKPDQYHLVGKLLSIEHLAIMYRGGDARWSEQLNRAMYQLMISGEGRRIYRKWFEQPTPPNQINFQMRPNPLLLRYMKSPSPDVGEYVVY